MFSNYSCKLFCVLSFILAFASITQGQNLEKLYFKAEKAFYKEKFNEANDLYTQLLEKTPNFKDAAYKNEISRLLLSENREASLETILSYVNTKGKKDKFFNYWMGRIYMNKYMFPEAVDALNNFLSHNASKSEEIKAETKDFIAEAQHLVSYFYNPDNFEIHPLDASINNAFAQMSPTYFEENKELIYASASKDNPESLQIIQTTRTDDYNWSRPTKVKVLGEFEKDNANIEAVNTDGKLFLFDTKENTLLYSERTESGWEAPKTFDSKINSKNLASHFFINSHEDRIIFVTNTKNNGKDLMETHKDPNSGKWSTPTPLTSDINSIADEESPYLSPDEKTLYFSSNRKGGVGGYDVYVSNLNETTLMWSKPENLGWPINSPDDDIHFKMNDDLKSGYFISNRIYTKGDYDIFFFWSIEKAFVEGKVLNALTNEPVTSGEIRFHPSQYLVEYFRSPIDENGNFKAEIISDETFSVEIISGYDTLGVEAYEIHDGEGEILTHIQDFYAISKNASAQEIAAFQKKKKLLEELNARTRANALARKKDKKNSSATVTATITEGNNETDPQTETPILIPQTEENSVYKEILPDKSTSQQKEKNINYVITEQPAQTLPSSPASYTTGNKLIINNIYFDFGTSQLNTDAEPILNKILSALAANPNVKIEIGGHTDDTGDKAFNEWLSIRRAEKVKAWLINQNIPADRLLTKGYGETQPLASNDDELEGRALNRRIELLIIQ